jgi:hypothetical protein
LFFTAEMLRRRQWTAADLVNTEYNNPKWGKYRNFS